MPLALGPQPALAVPAPPAQADEYWITGEAVRGLVVDEPSLRTPLGVGAGGAIVRNHIDSRQWSLPGAYLLLWPVLPGNVLPVYIGSSGDLLERLNVHPQVGWVRAVMLTGHGLARAGAFQIEQGLGRVFLDADPNQTAWQQQWVTHPALDWMEMPWPLIAPAIILAERILRVVTGLELTFDPTAAYQL